MLKNGISLGAVKVCSYLLDVVLTLHPARLAVGTLFGAACCLISSCVSNGKLPNDALDLSSLSSWHWFAFGILLANALLIPERIRLARKARIVETALRRIGRSNTCESEAENMRRRLVAVLMEQSDLEGSRRV